MGFDVTTKGVIVLPAGKDRRPISRRGSVENSFSLARLKWCRQLKRPKHSMERAWLKPVG